MTINASDKADIYGSRGGMVTAAAAAIVLGTAGALSAWTLSSMKIASLITPVAAVFSLGGDGVNYSRNLSFGGYNSANAVAYCFGRHIKPEKPLTTRQLADIIGSIAGTVISGVGVGLLLAYGLPDQFTINGMKFDNNTLASVIAVPYLSGQCINRCRHLATSTHDCVKGIYDWCTAPTSIVAPGEVELTVAGSSPA